MNILKSALFASCLLPALSLANESNTARIITSGERPAECISAVHVNRIDDREVKVEEVGFVIDAGVHTMSARAKINTSLCNVRGGSAGRHTAEALEAEFEAGKTYWIGYDHSATSSKDWKLVIWKVEGNRS